MRRDVRNRFVLPASVFCLRDVSAGRNIWQTALTALAWRRTLVGEEVSVLVSQPNSHPPYWLI